MSDAPKKPAPPLKKWAERNGIDPEIARRIREQVKASQKAKHHFGDMADAVDRAIGHRVHGDEIAAIRQEMTRIGFNPPTGYNPDVTRPRFNVDDKKMQVSDASASKAYGLASKAIAEFDKTGWRGEVTIKAWLADAADAWDVAGDAAEEAGHPVRGGTYRQRAKFARAGDIAKLRGYGI